MRGLGGAGTCWSGGWGPVGGGRVVMPGPRRPSASGRRLGQWSGRLAVEVIHSGLGASPCPDQEEGLGRPPFWEWDLPDSVSPLSSLSLPWRLRCLPGALRLSGPWAEAHPEPRAVCNTVFTWGGLAAPQAPVSPPPRPLDG